MHLQGDGYAMIVRVNPQTPCQPDGAHHPHRYACYDMDCCGPEAFDEKGNWLGELGLECCVCYETWPCKTKREHVLSRKEKKL